MASILCFKNDQVWFSQSCDAQCHIHVKSISISFPSSGVLMLWQISPLPNSVTALGLVKSVTALGVTNSVTALGLPNSVTALGVANCGGGKWSHVHRSWYKTWHETGAILILSSVNFKLNKCYSQRCLCRARCFLYTHSSEFLLGNGSPWYCSSPEIDD